MSNDFHLQVQFFSDASNLGWDVCLFSPGRPEVVTRGYWDEADRGRPIIVTEIQALRLTLENLLHRSENTRMDVFVDNKALVSSWENHVSKSPEVSAVMKSIFQSSLNRNLSLSLQYVPSQSNPADSPSRTLSDLDASLGIVPWNLVDSTFGSHTIDLMALLSNVKLDRFGRPLKFFSPFPCVQAQGTNVFFSNAVIQRKRLCVSTVHTYGPALEVPDVATMPFYNCCPRCLAQEILVAPPPSSSSSSFFRCIQIGPKGG